MKLFSAFLSVVFALLAFPATAEIGSGVKASEAAPIGIFEASGSDCAGGLAYDDGTFEEGYGFSSGTFTGDYAMRMVFPPGTNTLKAVCVCWRRLGVVSQQFAVTIWAADGPGG